MGVRSSLTGVVVVLLGVLLAFRQANAPSGDAAAGQERQWVTGRNNTVLFLCAGAHGLSNVHLATALSLHQRYPGVDVHVASFENVRPRVGRLTGGVRPITFHGVPGPDFIEALLVLGYNLTTLVHRPGLRGAAVMYDYMASIMAPFSTDDHIAIYRRFRSIIDEVDPAVVVVDHMMRPAAEAVDDARRFHAILTPNALTDFLSGEQPRGQVLWKYPSLASGFPYPVPWRKVPENVLMTVRLAVALLFNPALAEKKRALREGGISSPLEFVSPLRPEIPMIAQYVEGGALPLENVPAMIHRVGPITISVAPAAEQDPELAAWVRRGPTVLVNLGSNVMYTEQQARAMAEALAAVLEAQPRAQVIWKFRKAPVAEGEAQYGDDVVGGPLRRFVDEGRARLPSWLAIDPTALLETGDIAVSVHHGGANVFNEALLTGVPHVVLPIWADLYNYAALVEDFGLGYWACRPTAPEWDAEGISRPILKLLAEDDPEAAAIRTKTKLVSERATVRLGRDHAADIVAELAGKGH